MISSLKPAENTARRSFHDGFRAVEDLEFVKNRKPRKEQSLDPENHQNVKVGERGILGFHSRTCGRLAES